MKDSKKSVYWNEYKSKVERKNLDNNSVTRFLSMLFFKEYQNCTYLLMITLLLITMLVLIESEGAVRENISSQE